MKGRDAQETFNMIINTNLISVSHVNRSSIEFSFSSLAAVIVLLFMMLLLVKDQSSIYYVGLFPPLGNSINYSIRWLFMHQL